MVQICCKNGDFVEILFIARLVRASNGLKFLFIRQNFFDAMINKVKV